jgi:hypothetical protein
MLRNDAKYRLVIDLSVKAAMTAPAPWYLFQELRR